MKIMETATFKFSLKASKSKDESYRILKEFLVDNNWLDENGMKRLPLHSYHSEISGNCEIVLAEEITTKEFKDLIDELFGSILARDDIKWVKTYYNENTFNIVQKEAGKYLNHQTVDLSNLKNGDEVCVFLSET